MKIGKRKETQKRTRRKIELGAEEYLANVTERQHIVERVSRIVI